MNWRQVGDAIVFLSSLAGATAAIIGGRWAEAAAAALAFRLLLADRR